MEKGLANQKMQRRRKEDEAISIKHKNDVRRRRRSVNGNGMGMECMEMGTGMEGMERYNKKSKKIWH
jgi:hypothetical protein